MIAELLGNRTHREDHRACLDLLPRLKDDASAPRPSSAPEQVGDRGPEPDVHSESLNNDMWSRAWHTQPTITKTNRYLYGELHLQYSRTWRLLRKFLSRRTRRSVPRWGLPETRMDSGAPQSTSVCSTLRTASVGKERKGLLDLDDRLLYP